MKYLNKLFIVALLFAGITACDFFDPGVIDDPNNASLDGVLSNASKAQIQNLVTGLEIRHRSSTGSYNIMGAFGREIYPFFKSDPRFMSEWMGLEPTSSAEDDPNFYSSGGTYTTPYAAIKQANVLIGSAENTEVLTDAERSGIKGFAKTIQAYNYLIPLNSQYSNGIRFDVADPQNLGPFLSFDDALTAIRGLLDEAQTDLNAAGGSFVFNISRGYADFNTPGTFIKLNRAIAARAAIYAEDWDAAITAANASFMSLTPGEESMYTGAYFTYAKPPDIFNPFYYERNNDAIQLPMVHPALVDSAEAGDARVTNKFFTRDDTLSVQGLSSSYQDDRYKTNEDQVPFFRNEELILIYAEALANRNQGADLVNAVAALNVIRNTWDLPDFVSVVQDDVIDQMLYERRYSLWFEGGHRWIDMRRYGRLNELPKDGGKIFDHLARPLSELNN